MKKIADFPYFEVQFDKKGRPVDKTEADELVEFLAGGGATDLLVLCHGWNNDISDARGLYSRWLPVIRAQVPKVPGAAARKIAVMAIFWPSKKFADRDEIPGGAAAFDAGGSVSEDDLVQQLEELKGGFEDEADDRALEEAKELVAELETSAEARRRFVEMLRSELLPPAVARADAESAAELPGELYEMPGDELLAKLAEEPEAPIDFEAGGAAGEVGGAAALEGRAAGFGEFFGGIKEGARNFLNLLTGYKMKNRAGLVGSGGVHEVLARIRREAPPVRLHLAGHSFGARVLSAAAGGPDGAPPLEVDSLTLVQGAFSHFSFSDQWDPPQDSPGFFRRVVTDPRVRGPMLVTHTKNDLAVGIGYALAFRLAGRDAVAAAIGDENDIFGGLGRNGALKTPEAKPRPMLASGGDYGFGAGEDRVFNLNSDEFIKGHSKFVVPEVAYAILSAVAAT